MPYSLKLPRGLVLAGWKVKIFDAEIPAEEPHVTIYKKSLKKGRLSLRTEEFLDLGDKWSKIDKDVKNAIKSKMKTLRDEWDKLHGDINPISSEEEE